MHNGSSVMAGAYCDDDEASSSSRGSSSRSCNVVFDAVKVGESGTVDSDDAVLGNRLCV
jgi:hypothetical protein